MKKGSLYTKVFCVVILTVVMTAFFTAFIYSRMASSVFTRIKEDELLPRAKALGNVITQMEDALEINKDRELFHNVLTGGDTDLLGAYVVVIWDDGTVWLDTDEQMNRLMPGLQDAAKIAIRNGKVVTSQIPALRYSSLVTVGVSITRSNGTKGAVLMIVPLTEVIVAMGSMNSALVLSLLAALPFVALLVYLMLHRLMNPLRQMRDVAVGMAHGNFEARADVTQRGEVGQLAKSLNFLSRELNKTIAVLTLERNRLQKTLNGLKEGIIAVDQDSHVTNYNPAIKRLFALYTKMENQNRITGSGNSSNSGNSGNSDSGNPDSAAGTKNTILDSEERIAEEEKWNLIPDMEVWQDFSSVIHDGNEILRLLTIGESVLQMHISPIMDDNGKIAGAVGLFSDVTEAERLERTRREYVANVSHEMRTPLTAMRALLEPLTEGMVTDVAVQKRYYAIMLRETLRLSRLINDLMELSRLQSGQLSMQLQKVNLLEIVDELAAKYTQVADEHGLKFVMDVTEDCPDVISNPDRLEQVLVILLDNAMKYTKEKGTVTLSASWDDTCVIMTVRDTGIGIDPKDQEHVFDRFYKVDKAHTGMGSGLGLSIAKEIMDRLGEHIWVESTPGEGSAFSFSLHKA